jgi:hypothetical protein
MNAITRAVDALYRFHDLGRAGCCRLRLFNLGPDRPAVAIVTELDVDGVSITNAAEALAESIAQDFGLDVAGLLFVEHLLPSSFGPEQFAAVSFETGPDGRLQYPQWRPITRGSIEHLVGAPLFV